MLAFLDSVHAMFKQIIVTQRREALQTLGESIT